MAQKNLFQKVYKVLVGFKSQTEATQLATNIAYASNKNEAIKAMSGAGIPKTGKKAISRLLKPT